MLRRHRDPEGRRSLFDAAQVGELARGGRPRRPAAPAELVIESSITALRDGRPFYRGRDALELAGSWSFEQAALWLWNEGTDDAGPWPTVPEALPPAVAAQSGLPAGTLPRERLQVIAAVLAATDPLRHVAGRAAAITAGQRFITAMLDCLPAAGPGPPQGTEDRLWRALCPAPADPDLLAVLRSALIVLADHELAASTWPSGSPLPRALTRSRSRRGSPRSPARCTAARPSPSNDCWTTSGLPLRPGA